MESHPCVTALPCGRYLDWLHHYYLISIRGRTDSLSHLARPWGVCVSTAPAHRWRDCQWHHPCHNGCVSVRADTAVVCGRVRSPVWQGLSVYILPPFSHCQGRAPAVAVSFYQKWSRILCHRLRVTKQITRIINNPTYVAARNLGPWRERF